MASAEMTPPGARIRFPGVSQRARRTSSSPARDGHGRARAPKPIADALKAWAEEISLKLSGQSELAAAFRYMLARWLALNRCSDDDLDNNPAERAFRGVAQSRFKELAHSQFVMTIENATHSP